MLTCLPHEVVIRNILDYIYKSRLTKYNMQYKNQVLYLKKQLKYDKHKAYEEEITFCLELPMFSKDFRRLLAWGIVSES